MTSTDSRPASRPVRRSADRRLRSGVGPRRGGLNGRRNAVKPFCHSRRSRSPVRQRGIFNAVSNGRGAPLAFTFRISLSSSLWRVIYFNLINMTYNIIALRGGIYL